MLLNYLAEIIDAAFFIAIPENAALNKVGLKGPTEKVILSAMKEWEEKTCIRFKPRTDERDYIEFIDGGFGRLVLMSPMSCLFLFNQQLNFSFTTDHLLLGTWIQ